jgi:signal peptidase II
LILLGGGTALIDQSAKLIVLRSLVGAGGVAESRHGFLQLVINQRPLFARAGTGLALVALWVLAAGCVVAALAVDGRLGSHALVGVGFAVGLGGAAGNLCDRLTRGAVVDFVSIGRWPAFNLADVAIVAGVAVAVGSFV